MDVKSGVMISPSAMIVDDPVLWTEAQMVVCFVRCHVLVGDFMVGKRPAPRKRGSMFTNEKPQTSLSPKIGPVQGRLSPVNIDPL